MQRLTMLFVALLFVAFIPGISESAAWSSEKGKVAVSGKQPLVAMSGIRTWPSCIRVRATLQQLKQKYGQRVRFVELDVSDDQSTAIARKQAKTLGVTKFLKEHEEVFPAVVVLSARGREIAEFDGVRQSGVFEAAIERALAAK